jgi:hypothetical protein
MAQIVMAGLGATSLELWLMTVLGLLPRLSSITA